ncbi:1279_t:CDS:2, partial [Dentiscutata erythropus]
NGPYNEWSVHACLQYILEYEITDYDSPEATLEAIRIKVKSMRMKSKIYLRE